MAKPCYHSIYQISYFWYLQLKLALSATASTHFNSVSYYVHAGSVASYSYNVVDDISCLSDRLKFPVQSYSSSHQVTMISLSLL